MSVCQVNGLTIPFRNRLTNEPCMTMNPASADIRVKKIVSISQSIRKSSMPKPNEQQSTRDKSMSL